MGSVARKRNLHRRAFREAGLVPDEPCSIGQFHALVDYERMRADRNGSVFSLVLLAPLNSQDVREDGATVAAVLDARLRLTDEIGWWDARTVGVLLTDTPTAGAWKVIEDLNERLDGQIVLACSVYAYPEQTPPATESQEVHEGEHPTVENVAGRKMRGSPHPDARGTARRLESLLVRPTPWWKRLMDVLGALMGFTLLAPLLVTIAAAVKLSSRGPIVFRQQRQGRGGREFALYKFRTMCADAQERKQELLALNEQDGPAFKLHNDPRITRVGRYLRWTCLDELPQLWNVLRGEMSLVGPRPLPVEESEACEPWQRRRLAVSPGLTCTWQLYGKSAVSFAAWMRMDLRYIETRSFVQDVRLILGTLLAVVLHRASH